MLNYTIRKIRVEELTTLCQLFHYNDVNVMIEENKKEILENICSIYILLVENKLIGELHVKYVSDDFLEAIPNQRAYLYAYRIHKDFQGQGWGRLLLTTVINNLEKDGYRELTVGVEDDNSMARHIYLSLGFLETVARKTESYQENTYQYDLLLRESSNRLVF